jgi:hypothetical protein
MLSSSPSPLWIASTRQGTHYGRVGSRALLGIDVLVLSPHARTYVIAIVRGCMFADASCEDRSGRIDQLRSTKDRAIDGHSAKPGFEVRRAHRFIQPLPESQSTRLYALAGGCLDNGSLTVKPFW